MQPIHTRRYSTLWLCLTYFGCICRVALILPMPTMNLSFGRVIFALWSLSSHNNESLPTEANQSYQNCQRSCNQNNLVLFFPKLFTTFTVQRAPTPYTWFTIDLTTFKMSTIIFSSTFEEVKLKASTMKEIYFIYMHCTGFVDWMIDKWKERSLENNLT